MCLSPSLVTCPFVGGGVRMVLKLYVVKFPFV